MQRVVGLLFCITFFFAFFACAEETSSFKAAIDVALGSLSSSGKFAAFANKYGLNSTKPACPSSATSYPSATGILKTVLDSGSVTFCRALPYAIPFWNDTSNTGFLLDVIDGIMEEWKSKYGKKLAVLWHYVSTKGGYFPALQTAVNSGTCHAVAEIVTVTAARTLLVDFTCPYTSITSGFLRGPLDATRTNLTTLTALNDPSVTVGVIAGSVYDTPSGGVWSAKLVRFTDDSTALSAVANQQVHATLMGAPFTNNWLLSNPCNGCKYYGDGKAPQEYAIFVKMSSSANSIVGGMLVSLIFTVLLIVLTI